MPTRLIRETLLSSDRFLTLPDNTARMCYIACLLTADDRGNREAGLGPLVRLWRDFGVDGTEKAAAVSQFLADQDLIRFYEVDGKRYLHVPRFGQRLRSFKRSHPSSPWCKTSEESTKTSSTRQQSAATGGDLSVQKRSEEKRSEEKRRKTKGADAPFVLPDWIPKAQWDAWIEARIKMRKAPTEWAKHLAVLRLGELKERGHQPAAVLAESAFNGWAGLFPNKEILK